ncbi:hypothetical protein ES332_D07G187900v1 [Gossypium tomentosum]|uniref:Uncharacterized protein n=1 Tax=Gossypium tomentosum TaxID=34277 RepID=A0A5D2K8Z7_GOSTO|nr:hypothetical protein ES332_D07G187900v1 [Gossypium tomentosum]
MSEFTLACKKKNDEDHELSRLLVSDFILFCSSIFSHPLYFSYFIFFSPYFVKLLSFLSPLFFTTTLLVLTLFILDQSDASICHLESKLLTSLLTAYQTLVETLRCEIVFETSNPLQVCPDMESKEAPIDKGLDSKPAPETNQVKAVVKIFEDFLQEKERVENFWWKKRDRQVESKAMWHKAAVSGGGNPQRVKAENTGGYYYDYNSEAKEWKKTLAWKLLEERRSDKVEGDEGMDLLWETYETESNLKSNSKKGKKGGNEGYDMDRYEYEYGYGYGYEEESVPQLCCLHALKSNIVKISKALKGFGWLHHLGNKHGKKGTL